MHSKQILQTERFKWMTTIGVESLSLRSRKKDISTLDKIRVVTEDVLLSSKEKLLHAIYKGSHKKALS